MTQKIPADSTYLAKSFEQYAIKDLVEKRTVNKQFFQELLRSSIGAPSQYGIRFKKEGMSLIKTLQNLTDEAAKSGVNNAYHNPLHTAHVTLMTSFFCKHAGLSGQPYLIALIAAMAHDLGHKGEGNPKNDPTFNEKRSAEYVEQIMKKYRCKPDEIKLVKAIIISTSPNGPHAYLKNNLKGDGGAAEQTILSKPAYSDYKEIAKIVCDSDIFASAGTSLNISTLMAKALDREAEACGSSMRVNNDQARMYFLKNIVGEQGFSSKIAKKLANMNYWNIRKTTEHNLLPT